MVQRLFVRLAWHAHGLLLWLLPRPYLRYLPIPYQSVENLVQWQSQCQTMATAGCFPKRHLTRAKQLNAFTMSNLAELKAFGNRMGLRFAFLEDPLLQGMMAAKSSKGMASRLKREAALEAQQLAQKAEQENKTQDAIRSLVGPRGGLPTLRGDLIKLAALLHVEITDKMTVEDIKTLCRPVIKDLKMETKPKVDPGSGSSHQPPAAPKAATPSPAAMSSQSTAAPAADQINLGQLRHLFAQQDQRYQTMLNQVMQQVMAVQGKHPQQFNLADASMEVMEDGWTQQETDQINADYWTERDRERYEAQHGEFSSDNPFDLIKGAKMCLKAIHGRSIRKSNLDFRNRLHKPGNDMNVTAS